jgi:hypothetical protein
VGNAGFNYQILAALVVGLIVPATLVVRSLYNKTIRERRLAVLSRWLEESTETNITLVARDRLMTRVLSEVPEVVSFLVALGILGLVVAPGFAYALLPQASLSFPAANVFILSASFAATNQVSGHQVLSLSAVVAAFLGAYITTIFRLFRLVEAGQLTPASIIGGAGRILTAGLVTLTAWHAIAATGWPVVSTMEALAVARPSQEAPSPAMAVSPQSLITGPSQEAPSPAMASSPQSLTTGPSQEVPSPARTASPQSLTNSLFVFCFLIGLAVAAISPYRVASFLHRALPRPRTSPQTATQLELIDGLERTVRAKLSLAGIRNVQSLGTANPLRLLGSASTELTQIVDWVGQAQLAMWVGLHALARLRAAGVRTIFDLERGFDDPDRTKDIVWLLNSAPRSSEPSILTAFRYLAPWLRPTEASAAHTEGYEGTMPSPFASVRFLEGIVDQVRESPQFLRLGRILEVAKNPEVDTLMLEDSAGLTARITGAEVAPVVARQDGGIVARYPSMKLEGRIATGERFYFLIDLLIDRPPSDQPDEAEETTETYVSPDDSTEGPSELAVVVELYCPPVILDPDKGVVLIQRGRASTPCRIAGSLPKDAELPPVLDVCSRPCRSTDACVLPGPRDLR